MDWFMSRLLLVVDCTGGQVTLPQCRWRLRSTERSFSLAIDPYSSTSYGRKTVPAARDVTAATEEQRDAYGRSVRGGVKNAIDVASRPCQQSAWNGKPHTGRNSLRPNQTERDDFRR